MLHLLLVAAFLFTQPVDVIVLRDGYQMPVAGEVEVENDRAIFRGADGKLYSLPLEEIDVDATERLAEKRNEPAAQSTRAKKLKATDEELDRILRELESRSLPYSIPPPAFTPLPETPTKAPSPDDEWKWRKEARRLEENLRRAREELVLLEEREERLEDQIRGFLSLGYDPRQFTHEVGKLERTRDAMERAELNVTRAERALEQFRDDARRQNILPGWLR